MEIIKINLTKHQLKMLNPLQAIVEKAYSQDEPGAIVAQVLPEDGIIKCAFYNHEQMLELHNAYANRKEV